MTELIVIRHGETAWNVEHRWQGQTDVPLNATGHAQAAALAARVAADPGDVLYSSDLTRAMQTAAPLAAEWGQTVRPVPGLREQGFGLFEGLTARAIQREHPALWLEWLSHHADFGLPGGESLAQVSARVLDAVAQIAARHPRQRVVIVTHGGVLDTLWRHAHGLPLSGLRECLIPNTGVNRLRFGDGRLYVDGWADDAHLGDASLKASTTVAASGVSMP